ncbi:MAG: Clp1/GlmU family protein [Nitrospirota bacterium]|nr:Clp1/GlmU family protein [Nitrospirota bacterium]MDH5768499.1 Clp1/GlmU family protein [Nitrospirota bacterium]
MEIIPESEWERLIEELVADKGTAILIGATDSGKSTLTRYLIEKLVSRDSVTSFVDSDIGQSSLGIPGTISMKIFGKAEDIEDFSADNIFFVGSLNPAKNIPLMIDGTKKMVNNARKYTELILVDTTGLIYGEYGKALKIGKIRALTPQHIFAIQRYDELEHILTMIEDIKIHRIEASQMVKKRSRETRIRYRKKRFDEYFDKTKLVEFLLDGVSFFYNGRQLIPKEVDFKEGTLIGLNHNEDTKALGILLDLENTSITFKSPIQSVKGINRVILGDINLYEQEVNILL